MHDDANSFFFKGFKKIYVLLYNKKTQLYNSFIKENNCIC